MNAVEVRSAYKYFGNEKKPKIVLNRLNMTVKYGSIYGLLGPSGCGKTILLSCIVGIKDLNDGTIKVLGGTPGSKESGVPGPRVGYMPQESALVGEFSVKETVYYFGRIYGMNKDVIHERYTFMKKFLQLPYDDLCVNQLSGGQLRCVSFAASMIHEPELLILDEPTCGLDPLLREKIWDYLVEASTYKKLTVIITTHFIEEAKQAHCLGVMQNGNLLAEDSPQNILAKYELTSLEEAFLKICLREKGPRQLNGTIPQIEHVNNICDRNPASKNRKCSKSLQNGGQKDLGKDCTHLKSSSRRRLKGLLTKNFTSLWRQPSALVFLLCFPITSLWCFYYAVGADPKGLKLGIISDELNDYTDCFNKSLVTTSLNDSYCDLYKVSCNFISHLNDSVAFKEPYKDIETAIRDARVGKIVGFLHFASNFSESIKTRRDEGQDTDDGTFENSEIRVYLDKSNYQFTFFLEKKLFQTYKKFAEDLMSKCKLPIKLGNIPVNFLTPIYGSLDEEFTNFFSSGVIMTMIFFLATLTTSTVFITDRLDGIWNRTLIAGATTKEILFSHIITQSVIVFVQCLEVVLICKFVLGMENNGDNLTVVVLLVLQGFSGMLYGLFISVFCESHTTANFVTTGTFFPMVVLCGIIWPLEGMPLGLKYFSLLLPFTCPSMAIRNILSKGWSIMQFPVYIGYVVTLCWICIFITLCLLFLKIKK